jgi:hypothetical protein
MRIAFFVVVGLSSVTASASPRVAVIEPQGPGWTSSDEPAVPAPQGVLDLAQSRDGASDRGIAIGTAIPVPAGAVEVGLRDASSDRLSAGMANIAAGITRELELSAEAGTSFDRRASTFGVGAKLVAIRRAGFALAFEGSYHSISVENGDSLENRPFYIAGAKITGCFEATCSVLATVGLSGLVLENVEFDGDGSTKHLVLPLLSGSLMFGTGIARPFVEGLVSFGALGIMGVRIGGRNLALDLGVGGGMVAGSRGRGSTNALIGLTYRL